MQDLSQPISSCRHCRFYQPEGRRGGQCQQLNVTVQGAWQACSLVESPFIVVEAGEQKKLAPAGLEEMVATTSSVLSTRL